MTTVYALVRSYGNEAIGGHENVLGIYVDETVAQREADRLNKLAPPNGSRSYDEDYTVATYDLNETKAE